EGNRALVVQQHRFDPGGTQARQLTLAARAAGLEWVEGELLDFRSANGSVQVVMQPAALRLAEEGRGQMLQLTGTQRLGAAVLIMAAVEQAIDVVLDIAL